MAYGMCYTACHGMSHTACDTQNSELFNLFQNLEQENCLRSFSTEFSSYIQYVPVTSWVSQFGYQCFHILMIIALRLKVCLI